MPAAICAHFMVPQANRRSRNLDQSAHKRFFNVGLNQEWQLLCSLLAEGNIQTYSPNERRRFGRALNI